jgi:hypothetical protein
MAPQLFVKARIRTGRAESGASRDGPYFSLTSRKGKKTRFPISERAGATLARHVEAVQEFRERVERYWQAFARWGDTQLEAS